MGYYNNYEEEGYIPPAKLNENRDFLKFILLSLLTCGIYNVVFFISFSFDLNKALSSRDGKKTMNYLFVIIIAAFTLNIVKLCWDYEVVGRISDELERREIDYDFSTSDFWKWQVLGSFILVGPFIYAYKLIHAMNLICHEYNVEQEENEKARLAKTFKSKSA